jgi:predicted site-specific integrase-resolvase
MSVRINSETYYRTSEVCRMVGISRNTLFRWLREGVFDGVEHRDWRGWRLFTVDQIDKMKAKTCQINSVEYRKATDITSRFAGTTDDKQ